MNEVFLPELGEGIKKATVACWHVKPGEMVTLDEDLVEVVTDKASFCIPAPKTGRLQNILIAAGEEATIGEVLGIIGS